jgi:hypothetical protein
MLINNELKDIHSKDMSKIKDVYRDTFDKELAELKEFYDGKLEKANEDLAALRNENHTVNFRLSEALSSKN